MNVQRASNVLQKAVISVSAMAQAVGLSRARFYELVEGGVFLPPIYSVATHRPLYLSDMIETNLRVRATNVGVNGQYVLFYDSRQPAGPLPVPSRLSKRGQHANLLAGLQSLGLTATVQQVEAALGLLYPKGTSGVADEIVLRTVYRHLRRQGPG